MLRVPVIACVAMAFVTVTATALEDAPLTAQSALEQAIDTAASHGEVRWAFTMRRIEIEDGEERSFTLRFDPRRAPEDRWTLLEPSLESLSKNRKKALKQLRENGADGDDQLVYDKLEIDFSDAALRSDDDERAVFVTSIDDEEMPKKMREAVEMIVTVNKLAAFVETIEVRSTKPFKPAPVAKLERFSQVQTYALQGDGGPALLTSSHSDVAGKAMLKKFDSKSRTEYFDFESVPAEAVAATPE